SDGRITARNKFLALQSLRQAGIPIPRSILLASRPNFMEAAHLVRYPAVLKILSGTQGIGVMRVKSLEETASIVDTLKFFGEVVCLQEYIPNPGVDIRALVVSGRVVGSMKRVAAHNEWRANIHLGAKGVAIELPDHAKEIAVPASKAVGLEISAIDMIFRGDTPYGLEANTAPGVAGLFAATHGRARPAVLDLLLGGEGEGLGTRELHGEGIGEGPQDRGGGTAEVRGGHRGICPRDLRVDRCGDCVERLARVRESIPAGSLRIRSLA